MADSPKFYKAVDGITDGMAHHADGEVFPASESLDAHYAATGGKSGDRVLYESASQKDYDEYVKATSPTSGEQVNEDGSVPLGVGAPSGFDVVGGGAYDNIVAEDVVDVPDEHKIVPTDVIGKDGVAIAGDTSADAKATATPAAKSDASATSTKPV